MEYQQLHTLLLITLSAISTATQTCNSGTKSCEPVNVTSTTESTIRGICAAAHEALTDDALWRRVEESLVLAQDNMVEANKLLREDREFRSKDEESVLCILNNARIHIGIGLGLLLSPSTVDPVAVAGDEYHCIQTLVRIILCGLRRYIQEIVFL